MSESVRSNDTPFVIHGVANAGAEGRDQTWAFVKSKFPVFLERYSGGFLFTRLVQVTSNFTSMDHYKDVEVCREGGRVFVQGRKEIGS